MSAMGIVYLIFSPSKFKKSFSLPCTNVKQLQAHKWEQYLLDKSYLHINAVLDKHLESQEK